MKKYLITSLISLLAGIIIACLLFKSCDDVPNDGNKITSDTVWRQLPPVIVHDTMKIPKPYFHTVYKTEMMHVDTAAIIAAYYTENRYNPSYKDSNLELHTDIAVFNNQLKSFTFDYTIYQKEKIITKTNVETKTELFSVQLGLGFSYNIQKKEIGGVVGIGTNIKGSCIDFNYDFSNRLAMGTLKYKFFRYTK